MDISSFDGLAGLVEAVAASLAVIEIEDGRAGRISACNSQFHSMLGLAAEDGVGKPLREIVPRYARRELLPQIEACIESIMPVETVQAFDFAGRTRWWRLTAQPILKGPGKPTAVLLTCLDITDKVQLENDLKIANSRFSAVVQSAYDGIVTVDREQRIRLFNAAAEEMFGYGADEVVGQPLDILIPDRYRGHHGEHVETFARSPIQSRQMFERGNRLTGRAKDGSEFPIEVSIAKIQIIGATEFTAVVRDISERARLIDELRQQATVDLLTGLTNRRAFYTHAAQERTRAARKGWSLSAMMIDIDRFKSINDCHGHAAGDMVLRAMASAFRSVLRKSEIFARIGGEEFAVLLSNADENQCAAVAERLRDAIAHGRFDHDWGEIARIPFTVSIGVAPCFKDDVNIDEALKRADAALYAAKGNGRNRVELWSQLEDGASPRHANRPVVALES